MTKAQALKRFFNSFEIQAYPVTAVPQSATYPYMTYETPLGAYGDGEMNCTVQLWYNTTSEAVPNAKVEQISQAIGMGGMQIRCDEGCIWIKKGSPFCTAFSPESDNSIKLRQLNITLEYLTF